MFPGGQKSHSVRPASEALDDEPSIEMVPTGEFREQKLGPYNPQQLVMA